MAQTVQTTANTTGSGSSSFPAWTQTANQNLHNAALAMSAPHVNVPNFTLAGFNPDQMRGFDYQRGMATNAFESQPTQITGPTSVNPVMGTASQVGGAQIAAQMNPYMSAVINPAIQSMGRDRNAKQASIGAQAASAGSFGGSREAIHRGQVDRAYNENVGSLVGQLMAQGYDRATATALSNAGMAQQMELANVGAQNRGQEFNVNSSFQKFGAEEAARDSQFGRQRTALQDLLGTGSMQQLFAQEAISQPRKQLEWYSNFVPQVYDQSTTRTGATVNESPDNSPSTFQQVLGLGGTLLGGFLGK